MCVLHKNFLESVDKCTHKEYTNKVSNFYIAGWSSWQLVGLITQRSIVRVYPPQPKYKLGKYT